MKRIAAVIILICCVFVAGGCSSRKKKASSLSSEIGTNTAGPVKSVELAEAILWPKPYRFPVSRDPFKPLLWKNPFSSGKIGGGEQLGLRLIGVVVLGEEAVALVEITSKTSMGPKTSVLHEGDVLGDYSVERITSDKVILAKGKEKLVLKIESEKGGENEYKSR